MASRSHYGSGTVTERSKGVWQLRVSLGTDPITGKHRRATKTVQAKNRKEAVAELAKFQGEDHGRREGSSLGGLIEEYIDASHEMSPSTRVDFRGYVRRYLPDTLSRRRLRDITSHDLDLLYLHLLRKGGKDGKGLSEATVRRMHVILHAALRQAVKWRYIPLNPADDASPPKVRQTEVTLPLAEQLVAMLAAVDTLDRKTNPLPDFLALLLGTGARAGELCALPWSDVDLAEGTLLIDQSVARGEGRAVVKQTKTGKGRRVSLPAALTEVLRDRYARASTVEGVPLDEMPVFPSTRYRERPFRPDSMSRLFRDIRDEHNLTEDLTLRNLRHYCTSVLAAEGVDVVTVAKRMGHSPKIMLSVYAHLFEEGDRAAADVLGRHLSSM
jgi:integrase